MRNLFSTAAVRNPGSIWIMGLSSAGKSTLASMLAARLRRNAYPCMLLDGDQIRGIFDERLGYDPDSRRRQTRRVMALTRWIASQGILPVVAIIHPFEDDRVRCRAELDGYFEVFLKCGITECMRRDTKNVYRPAVEGKTQNVVGLDIPYDPPECADLVLESDRMTPEAMLDALWQRIEVELLPNYQLRVVGG